MTAALPLTEREVVAHHEAGHALTLMDRGYAFCYITMHPRTPGAAGLVRRMAKQHRAMTMLDHSAVLAGGPMADMLALLRADARTRGVEFYADWSLDKAGEVLARCFADGTMDVNDEVLKARAYAEDERAFRDAVECTADGLVRRWEQVEALAQALLASPRRLTYREALAVVEGARLGHAPACLLPY